MGAIIGHVLGSEYILPFATCNVAWGPKHRVRYAYFMIRLLLYVVRTLHI